MLTIKITFLYKHTLESHKKIDIKNKYVRWLEQVFHLNVSRDFIQGATLPDLYPVNGLLGTGHIFMTAHLWQCPQEAPCNLCTFTSWKNRLLLNWNEEQDTSGVIDAFTMMKQPSCATVIHSCIFTSNFDFFKLPSEEWNKGSDNMLKDKKEDTGPG